MKISGTMQFTKKRTFKKDKQIQIYKPKYREALMKSKTQDVDGSSGNTQFEAFSI